MTRVRLSNGAAQTAAQQSISGAALFATVILLFASIALSYARTMAGSGEYANACLQNPA